MSWYDPNFDPTSMDYRAYATVTTQLCGQDMDYLDDNMSFDARYMTPAMERFKARSKDDPYMPAPVLDGDFSFGILPVHDQSQESLDLIQDAFAYNHRYSSPVDTILSSTSGSGWSSSGSIDPRNGGLGELVQPEVASQPYYTDLSWSPHNHDVPVVHMLLGQEHDILDKTENELYLDPYVPVSANTQYIQPVIKVEGWTAPRDDEEAFEDSTGATTPDDHIPELEEEDSDYNPSHGRVKVRNTLSRQPRSSQTAFKVAKTSKQSTSKISKSKLSRTGSVSSADIHHLGRDADSQHLFTCPLTPYGCNSHFTSKNEWKRHIQSQHLALGYWQCDLCPDESRPNVFNRKDLFTAHLHRMHFRRNDKSDHASTDASPSPKRGQRSNNKAKPKMKAQGKAGKTQAKDEKLELELEAVRSRCWIRVRSPPNETACVICAKEFSGPGSCDDWLEHVGRHLTQLSRIGTADQPAIGYGNGEPANWEADTIFAKWLVEHHLLEEAYPSRPGESKWRLVDRTTADNTAMRHRAENGVNLDDDVDAEGEDDN